MSENENINRTFTLRSFLWCQDLDPDTTKKTKPPDLLAGWLTIWASCAVWLFFLPVEGQTGDDRAVADYSGGG